MNYGRLDPPLVTLITIRPRHDKNFDVLIQASTLFSEKLSSRRFTSLQELKGYLLEFTALNSTGELRTVILRPGRIWPVCKRLKIGELHFDGLPWSEYYPPHPFRENIR